MEKIKNFYDRWNTPYHAFSSNPIVQKWRIASIRSLDLQTGDSVADIGCGTGANTPILQNAVGPSGNVICVDLSSDSLSMIRKRSENNQWQNVHTLQADATSLPLSDIENYYASFSIGMFPNPKDTVRRWCSDLSKGSRLSLLNVVKGNEEHTILDKSIGMFTGISVPANIRKKIQLSVSGDGLDTLDTKVRSVHEYLRSNHIIIDEQEKLDGYVKWMTVEIR